MINGNKSMKNVEIADKNNKNLGKNAKNSVNKTKSTKKIKPPIKTKEEYIQELKSCNIYDDVINFYCSYSELKDFKIDITSILTDLEYAFYVYFRLEHVKRAIDLYKNGKIDDKYLAVWAKAYKAITTAEHHVRFYNECGLQDFSENIIFEIRDCLDILTYFDSSLGNSFLDKIYNRIKFYADLDLKNWKIYYSGNRVITQIHDSATFLCINDVQKVFFTQDGELGIYCREAYISSPDLLSTISNLIATGYQRLSIPLPPSF